MNEAAPEAVSKPARRLSAADISSGLALAVSVFALAIGTWQTRLMQSQSRASVWPYLSIGYTYTNGAETNGFIWTIDNNGVGPALVQSTTLSLDGKPMRNWDEVLAALGTAKRTNMATTSFAGSVIPPNTNRETTVAAIRVDDRGLLAEGQRADIILVDDSKPLRPRIVAVIVAGHLVHLTDATRLLQPAATRRTVALA